MIKHIVMWTMKDEAEGKTKQENMAAMKALLETLPAKVPGVNNLCVSTDIVAADPATDIALYCEFASEEVLKAYAVHPEHLLVVEFIKKVVSQRRLLDMQA